VSVEPEKARADPMNWETVAERTELQHKGRTFDLLVIPVGTHIFRGFGYDDAYAPDMDAEEMKSMKEFVAKQYKKKKSGIYYGNLGVGAFYAVTDPQRGYNYPNREVFEYRVKAEVRILDMQSERNIDNILLDEAALRKAASEKRWIDEDDSLAELFTDTYGYHDKGHRESDGESDRNVKVAVEHWLKLRTSPKLDGYGNGIMPGFHSEIVLFNPKKLEELCKYRVDNTDPILQVEKGACVSIPLSTEDGDVEFINDGKYTRVADYYKRRVSHSKPKRVSKKRGV
jgi:hypothetical protein